MLRGCALCILVTASAALGFVLSQRLSKRLGQLKILKRMTLFLHGEISCARVPLPEAFWSVGGKGSGTIPGISPGGVGGSGEIRRQQPGDRCSQNMWTAI